MTGVDLPHGDWARVEMAIGVLMQVCGWDATTARARLRRSADLSDVPITMLAAAILGLFP
jgi:AmiR/NasT family two-component response regulator